MFVKKGRNTSGKFWMTFVTLLGLLYLNGIVIARPGFDKTTPKNKLDVYDALPNFAAIGEKDIAAQSKEEILGATKGRLKRLSDQRRLELETLIALSEMTLKLANVIGGGRQLEATKRNRKKRAIFDIKNLQKLFRLSGKLGLKGNTAYPVVS
ncbi:unnamed protein product [Xylocopa violacea]|uniref:Uncharacterized protein n=1 Tax=Xylocopa violacea TaxID=135666 RepID=A0ABP1PEW0_XYLVO